MRMDSNGNGAPKISILFATLNESARLPRFLESIFSQDYPRELIEVVMADGGSTDDTRQIAERYPVRIIENPHVRCEPGVALAFGRATGEVAIVLAADNPLRPGFLRNIVAPFSCSDVVGVMPQVVSPPNDSATNRYFNAFTDPFNHFLYGCAVAPWAFSRVYPVARETNEYIIHDFRGRPYPLLAFAQGFAVRLPYSRPAGIDEDDIAPVMHLISAGGKIAYVPGAMVEHNSVNGLRHSLRKFGPRMRQRLTSSDQPIWNRSRSWSSAQRIRAYLWPFYAMSLLGPIVMAVVGLIRDRRAEWLFHPAITFAYGVEFWKQVLLVLAERARRRVIPRYSGV